MKHREVARQTGSGGWARQPTSSGPSNPSACFSQLADELDTLAGLDFTGVHDALIETGGIGGEACEVALCALRGEVDEASRQTLIDALEALRSSLTRIRASATTSRGDLQRSVQHVRRIAAALRG